MRIAIGFGTHAGKFVDELDEQQARDMAAGLYGGKHEGSLVHLACLRRAGRHDEIGAGGRLIRTTETATETRIEELPIAAQIALALFPTIAAIHKFAANGKAFNVADVVTESFDVAELFLDEIERME